MALLALTAAPASAEVVVKLAGTGAGTVTSNPAGINCSNVAGAPGPSCSASFGAEGVELTASPARGFTFTGWSGDDHYAGFFGPTCDEGSADPCATFDPTSFFGSGSNHITAHFGCPSTVAPPQARTGGAGAGAQSWLRTLEGEVDPGGQCGVEESYFEYGPTTEYGQKSSTTPNAAELGRGSEPVPVSAETLPLEPQTTYHYRLVAVAPGGTSRGEDRTFTTGPAPADSCPNAARRSEQGIRSILLPDCRAYEIVSEPNSADTANITGSYGFPDGKHVFYKSFLPTPGEAARNGQTEPFLATRTPTGWRQTAVSAPQGDGPFQIGLGVHDALQGVAFSGDFSEAFLMSPFADPAEEPRLNQTTSATQNAFVYRLSLASGAVSLQSLPDSGPLTQEMIETPACKSTAREGSWANPCGALLAGASADGARAFFDTNMKLATAPGTPQDMQETYPEIYERYGGHTYLVGVMPGGSVPSCGAAVGQGAREYYSYGAVAPSGADVVFTASDCATTNLYLRDVVDATTVQLPGSRYAGRAGTGPGEEEVVFTAGEGKFYEYHLTSGQTDEIGENAQGLLAYSPDGSRVYFLGPEAGIYVWHDGETKQVPGTQAGGYTEPVQGIEGGGRIVNSRETNYLETRNMPVASGGGSDGSHFLFIDTAKLTGYENEGQLEAYVYDAEAETVRCISCNPAGTAPEPKLRTQLIPAFMQDLGEQPYQSPSPPFISNDGTRAVFETTEALTPKDVNGTADVYEWELAGSNGCTGSSATYSAVIEGCVYLLSSGLGAEVHFIGENEEYVDGTHLVGASENLGDVYMLDDSGSLLPGLDNASHLIDVRVDGGFALPARSVPCEGEGCRGPAATPPANSTPGTSNFSGPEEGAKHPKPSGCRTGFVRRHGHCLRRRRRHHRRQHHRAARADRGAGR